jgi:hypothetical protein
MRIANFKPNRNSLASRMTESSLDGYPQSAYIHIRPFIEMLNKIIAVFFSLSFFFPTLVFLAFGKEANVFADVAFVYLFFTQLALWVGFTVLQRKNPRLKTVMLSGLGLTLFAVAVPVYYLTHKYDSWRDEKIIEAQRNTQVFDVSDEPFRSAAGNLLGVRLRYSVRFPTSDHASPGPRLLTVDESIRDFRGMTILNTTVEPRPRPLSNSPLPVPYGRYKGGITYHFTFETVPFYLIPSRDRSGFCMSFSNAEEEQLAQSEREEKFLISVGGTSADLYLTGKSPVTSRAYKLRDFYDGAVAEGARRPCKWDNEGNLR